MNAFVDFTVQILVDASSILRALVYMQALLCDLQGEPYLYFGA